MKCPSQYYYNSSKSFWEKCEETCVECSGNSYSCTSCMNFLILVDSICMCHDMNPYHVSPDSKISCLDGMDVSFNSLSEDSKYKLEFIFYESINQIDFTVTNINSLIKIYISNVPQSSF